MYGKILIDSIVLERKDQFLDDIKLCLNPKRSTLHSPLYGMLHSPSYGILSIVTWILPDICMY